MKKIKNLLVGLALVLLAILIDRGLDNATRRAAYPQGKDGATGSRPRHRRKLNHRLWEATMRRSFMFYVNAALLIIVACMFSCNLEAQDLKLLARRNVYVTSDWGIGSGFIYKKDTVLTAAHLLGPNMKVNGKPARPAIVDTAHDILLLVTPTAQLPDLSFNLVPTPLMTVIAVGNPLGKINFFSVGYVGFANAEIINTSNVVMAGYSGAGAYDRNGNLVGMVVAGEGNCTFGYTLDRLVSTKRLVLFLFEKSNEDIDALLRVEQLSRQNGTEPKQCPDKSPQPTRPP